MSESGLAGRDVFLSVCARALAGPMGLATREGVLRQKQLPQEIAGRRLGYYRDAAWAVSAMKAAGATDEQIRTCGGLRRDVVDALVIPWFDRAGQPGGLIYRRNTAVRFDNPFGETLVRYALSGERDNLPLDGAVEARAAGHDRVVVVEGTTDFLALRLAGVTDVVTAHTCAIRPPQLIHLRELGFAGLTVCFDPDFAGFRGTLSAIEGAFACGLDVRVAHPEQAGEDMDELVLRAGSAGFRALVAGADDGLEVYARAILQAISDAPDPAFACADLAARLAQLAPDDRARERLEARFWPIVDGCAGRALRIEAVARIATAAQGRRMHISPIGSLLKNRSGSARPWTRL